MVGKYILSCPDLMVQQSAKDVDRWFTLQLFIKPAQHNILEMGIQDSETEKWSHCNLTFFFCWPVGEDIFDFFKSAQGWDSIGAVRL